MLGENKIEIEVEDKAGNVKTYSTIVVIHKSSEEAVIDDSSSMW
jgi:hypothetical protein